MQRFWLSDHGSVSVYLIITVTVLFIFNVMWIDFSSLLTARFNTNEAAEMAAKSVMAGYDTELRKYSLFGLPDTPDVQKQTAQKAFFNNFASQSKGFLGAGPIPE